ncbi:uncharacterized protein [Physcomitrium patens]|uniref:uncharacterized protein n=1 Tax=Physcomitrium patens TaxID=3218 RepID=UPI003CCDCEAF
MTDWIWKYFNGEESGSSDKESGVGAAFEALHALFEPVRVPAVLHRSWHCPWIGTRELQIIQQLMVHVLMSIEEILHPTILMVSFFALLGLLLQSLDAC